jgi:hypothetical protein
LEERLKEAKEARKEEKKKFEEVKSKMHKVNTARTAELQSSLIGFIHCRKLLILWNQRDSSRKILKHSEQGEKSKNGITKDNCKVCSKYILFGILIPIA